MSVVYASFGDSGAERACATIGVSMAVASAASMADLVSDPSISPGDLTAGLIKAHLLGAASAMMGAQSAGQLDRRDVDELIRQTPRVLFEAIQSMREAR